MKVKITSEEKIRTERPIEELWLQLNLFESEHYSKQFLKEKYQEITNDELDKLSVVFSSNIKQAYEYYSSASRVSILTAPLLYYYGMLCLTNVLWASLNKTIPIGFSHGLGRSKDPHPHLADQYVTVYENGTFPALHSCFSDFPIKENTKFYVKDVLSVIPELKIFYEKIYGEKSRLIKLIRGNLYKSDTFRIDDGDALYLKELIKKNDSFIKQYNIEGIINLFDEITGIRPLFTLDNILIDYPLQKNMNGEIYLTLPIEFEKEAYAIPEVSAHFMVMHCLGMLVRYEPVKWLQIVSGKLSSDINIINNFIQVSKRKFPNMILNGLLGKDLQFTMSNIDFDDSDNPLTVVY